MTTVNTLDLVCEVTSTLCAQGIDTWLFGGWAEELRGVCAPRPHKDIDLLYPADDVVHLEYFLRTTETSEFGGEIVAKRFSHKRAFQWRGVMVEVILLVPEATGYVTDFFGLHRLEWPSDTLDSDLQLPDRDIRVASVSSLVEYRRDHGQVERAYQRVAAERR